MHFLLTLSGEGCGENASIYPTSVFDFWMINSWRLLATGKKQKKGKKKRVLPATGSWAEKTDESSVEYLWCMYA